MAKQALLKVFSGPHVGAEILLGEGAHSIGSGDSCDVILDDQLIDDHHATLMVAEGKTQLVAAPKSSVVIDGQRIDQSVLESFEFFTIGNTHLAVGPAGGSWPKMDFPDYQLSQPESHGEDGEQSEESEPKDDEASSEEADDAEAEETVQPQFVKATVMLSVLALLFLIAAFGNSIFPAAATQAAEKEISTKDLAEIVTSLSPEAQIHFEQRDGYVFAKGFSLTKADQRKLETELTAAQPSLQTRIRNNESLVTATASVLRMHKLDLQVESGKAGEVIVLGETDDEAIWSKARKRITRDVPLQALTDQVVVFESIPANEAALPTAALETDSSPVPSPSDTVAKESSPLKTPRQLSVSPIKLDVKTVSLGSLRVVTLRSGERLFVGGNIRGHIVTAIEIDHLLLEKNGSVRTIPFGT
ncbi:MAG: FHA domain-containing protein [Planctomycetota bacterium]